MENRRLTTEIKILGKIYPINRKGDYDMVLDVIEVLNDKELTDNERGAVALGIFYDFNLPETAEGMKIAADEMVKFINCGEELTPNNQKPIMDWNKDFPVLAAPINRVLGFELREPGRYVHWWTFVSAYMEIGECTFQTIIGIRHKKRKGKKLDKGEEEFYRNNRAKVDLPVEYSNEEEQLFRELLGDDYV